MKQKVKTDVCESRDPPMFVYVHASTTCVCLWFERVFQDYMFLS